MQELAGTEKGKKASTCGKWLKPTKPSAYRSVRCMVTWGIQNKNPESCLPLVCQPGTEAEIRRGKWGHGTPEWQQFAGNLTLKSCNLTWTNKRKPSDKNTLSLHRQLLGIDRHSPSALLTTNLASFRLPTVSLWQPKLVNAGDVLNSLYLDLYQAKIAS